VQFTLQAPAKAKASKAAKVLQPSNSSNQDQTIEDIYQKKTQLEHILLRPDTYIGSTEKQQQKMWVHDGEGIKLADIDYVPGLYKIFDEILVNAADNKVRDPKMDMLKVDIDKVSGVGRFFQGKGL
jgi:DNA topoisomerase-2